MEGPSIYNFFIKILSLLLLLISSMIASFSERLIFLHSFDGKDDPWAAPTQSHLYRSRSSEGRKTKKPKKQQPSWFLPSIYNYSPKKTLTGLFGSHILSFDPITESSD